MPKRKRSDVRASSGGHNSETTLSVSVSAAAAAPLDRSQADRSSGSISGADVRYAIKCSRNNLNAISVSLETENLKSGEKERKAQLVKLRNALKLFATPLTLHLARFPEYDKCAPGIIPGSVAKELKAFISGLEKIFEARAPDLFKNWNQLIAALPKTWGVSFSVPLPFPHEANSYSKTDDTRSGGTPLIENHDSLQVYPNDSAPKHVRINFVGGSGSQELPNKSSGSRSTQPPVIDLSDLDFECEEPFRSQLLTAGTGQKLEMGTKGFHGYFSANILSSEESSKRFTGNCELGRYTFNEMFDTLGAIHLAPNVPYEKKIDAIIKITDGFARERALVFQNQTDRSDYLCCWKDLYAWYGSPQHQITIYSGAIQNWKPKNSSTQELASFAGQLANLVVCLNKVDSGNSDANWKNAWNSLLNFAQKEFDEYAVVGIVGWKDEFKFCARDFYQTNPGPKLEGFKCYLYQIASTRDIKSEKMSVMKATFANSAPTPSGKNNSEDVSEHTKVPRPNNGACIVCGADNFL